VGTLTDAYLDNTAADRDHSTPMRTAGTRWESIGELFRSGVKEAEKQAPGWESAVMGYALLIFAKLKQAYIERSAGELKAEKRELLDEITAYIETYYANAMTLGDLAKRFYVSESTISHLFKQKMGVSLHQYVTQRRLIAAKNLILRGVPMEAVAEQVGFSDYSSFYRAFKGAFGISPRQFWNQV
jgi:AraC-like DNA-binding protein